ncbi:hypothetical protein IT774_07575 [Salinimonas marina]|uniref:Uncharacterized protein n=1 Tax=Salinimonas marina TaxID=2785918 RepID=A0A7S9DZT1_9ALTE|nr:hypothetical protein [Salinimonas marina]QPG06954.1 hypothetical protein IT774_07575 [Salinimonas marina]
MQIKHFVGNSMRQTMCGYYASDKVDISAYEATVTCKHCRQMWASVFYVKPEDGQPSWAQQA